MRWPLTILGLLLVSANSLRADDWPQWRGPQADGVWRETGIVEKLPEKQIPIKWRAPIGAGYNGPTVAAGRVYVMDRLVDPTQVERVHCFNAATGEPIWSYSYDCRYAKVGYPAGPRGCVTIDNGRAYALGTMGNLHCFDAAKGDLLWKHDTNVEYKIDMPIWGVSASPVLFGDLVIVHIGGSDGACVVAFDKKTGVERWKALDDRGQYATPVLTKQSGKDLLIVWTGDSVTGIAPADGKPLWRREWTPKNMPIGVATPVVDAGRVFCTSFYDGSLMLRLKAESPAVETIWQKVGPNERDTDALQSIISTPYLDGDYVYGCDSYGQLRCLDAKTGDRLWQDLTATPQVRWSTIHFVRQGDQTWMFNEKGELIIARLSPKGCEQLSRSKLIEPTQEQLSRRGEGVCWSHPAFANRCVFARNDKELVCASLAAE